MFAAPFAPGMPVEAFPPQFAGQPVPSFGRPPQSLAAPAAQAAAAPRSPVARFRAQSPDEPLSKEIPVPPRPTPIAMPSPEQLGVAPAQADAGGFDWSGAHRRLDLLGAVACQRERLAQGGYRFTCVLPTTQADRTHRVEAVAASEEEAVRLALQRAEAWAAGANAGGQR